MPINIKSYLCSNVLNYLLLVGIMLCNNQAHAQLDTMINGIPILRPQGTLVAFFMDDSTVTIQPGEIISKTIILYNLENKTKNIRIHVSAPPEWKRTNFSDRVYEIKGGEVLYLPASIIPNGKIKGNTKYLITVYVNDESGPFIGSSSFFAFRHRTSNWDINLLQNNKVYFKNKESKAKLNFSVFNVGNEDQPISMTVETYRSSLSVTDSAGKIVQGKFVDYILPIGGDTVFNYNVSSVEGIRNQRFLDTESHRPTSTDQTKTQSIYIKTTESKALGNKAIHKNKKVDFVQLGNEIKVTPFGYSYFPLTVEANINSIATGSPLANIFMRGNTEFENGTSVNYQLQTFFTSNYYNSNYLDYTNYFVGINNKKYTVVLGNISGIPEANATMPIPGKGAGAIYRINQKHSIGSFYTRSPGLFNSTRIGNNNTEGFGFSYGLTLKTFTLNAAYSKADYRSSGYTSDNWGLNTSKSFLKTHSISLGGMLANNILNSGNSTTGFIARGSHSGQYLKSRRLNTSTSLTYISKNFSYLNNGDGWLGSFNSSYNSDKKIGVQINSNFNKRILYFSVSPNNSIGTSYFNLNNQITINRSFVSSFISGSIFHNTSIINNNELRSRGIGLNVGSFEYDKNKLYSGSVMAGYTKPIYSPQLVNISLNHQHQFRDSHFILQQFLSYTYYDLNQRQTLSYMPELNFYTNNDWRFRLQIGYFLASTNNSGALIVASGGTTGISEDQTTVSQNVMANLGIRKTFGIKNPFSNNNYYTANIKAFVDINGNKKFDNDEYLLENVVVRINGWDVLTNQKGDAKLLNIPAGMYEISAFSLDDIKDYFPNLADTIVIARNYTDKEYLAIPFVKGVKIYGKVSVDRDLLSQQMEMIPEIGGIKITAENGKTIHALTENDGSFVFYAPYGDYTIIFDEQVLGTRYRLMENNIKVKIDKEVESVFVTFNIIEKRRKVAVKKFGANGSIKQNDTTAISKNTTVIPAPAVNNNVPNTSPLKSNTEQATITDEVLDNFLRDKIDVANTNGVIYTVQIGAFMKPLNPSAFDNINDIMYEIIGNNFVRIMSGQFTNEADCIKTLTALSARGFNDSFISAYYKGKRITLDEARQIKGR